MSAAAAAAESIVAKAKANLADAQKDLADAKGDLADAITEGNKETIEECEKLVSISRKAVISAKNTQIAAQDALTKILTSTCKFISLSSFAGWAILLKNMHNSLQNFDVTVYAYFSRSL